ncbi:MAG: carboxypeptidase-like regulatory domain-containing protein [Verrucomicrobia bacterium]|nr:carboxypeptidase-like regulatory domain-containing protein [Verrucomicrobiota bacterium]
MRIRSTILAGVVSALIGAFLWPGQAEAQPQYVVSPIISGEVQGFVFYADGETPAAEIPVRVYDINRREFIHETTTDEFGFYSLPRLEPGRYFLTFDWLKLEFEVLPHDVALLQQPHDVIVIIPRGLATISLANLSSLLFATTLTQGAARYETWEEVERPIVVSP